MTAAIGDALGWGIGTTVFRMLALFVVLIVIALAGRTCFGVAGVLKRSWHRRLRVGEGPALAATGDREAQPGAMEGGGGTRSHHPKFLRRPKDARK